MKASKKALLPKNQKCGLLTSEFDFSYVLARVKTRHDSLHMLVPAAHCGATKNRGRARGHVFLGERLSDSTLQGGRRILLPVTQATISKQKPGCFLGRMGVHSH